VSSDTAILQLKEIAKWSDDPEKKKTAIKELSAHGENALAALQEILNVTVYDEIKAACIDAIKADKERDSAADVTKSNKKKAEQEEEQEKGRLSLADLPP
jgi:hypothetical protein